MLRRREDEDKKKEKKGVERCDGCPKRQVLVDYMDKNMKKAKGQDRMRLRVRGRAVRERQCACRAGQAFAPPAVAALSAKHPLPITYVLVLYNNAN